MIRNGLGYCEIRCDLPNDCGIESMIVDVLHFMNVYAPPNSSVNINFSLLDDMSGSF